MITLLIVAMVATNVGLGAWLGLRYLRRAPRARNLVGLHLLIGLSMVEVLAVMLRGSPDGSDIGARPYAVAAAGLLAGAMLSGLAAPTIGQSRPRATGPALAVHATVATTAFVAVVVWAIMSGGGLRA